MGEEDVDALDLGIDRRAETADPGSVVERDRVAGLGAHLDARGVAVSSRSPVRARQPIPSSPRT